MSNARIQFSLASEDVWNAYNPQLKEGEIVTVLKANKKVKLVQGKVGGSTYSDSTVIWDEDEAETTMSRAEAAAVTATAQANAASGSASKAAASQAAAATSATNAKASENAAANSETNAKASATAAKNSATSSASSASTASTRLLTVRPLLPEVLRRLVHLQQRRRIKLPLPTRVLPLPTRVLPLQLHQL